MVQAGKKYGIVRALKFQQDWHRYELELRIKGLESAYRTARAYGQHGALKPIELQLGRAYNELMYLERERIKRSVTEFMHGDVLFTCLCCGCEKEQRFSPEFMPVGTRYITSGYCPKCRPKAPDSAEFFDADGNLLTLI